jgi:PD-(D/E)XK nuclease superfamily
MMNNLTPTAFNWLINESSLWPPRGRPAAPFGPTAIEIMHSCALRIYFECSKGYERRTAYAARVGIAFHRTMQSLAERPLGSSDPGSVVEEAARRFREELALQEMQKSARPREQMLARNEERVQRALEAVTVEALRLAEYPLGKSFVSEHKQQHTDMPIKTATSMNTNVSGEFVVVEIPVHSQDGLLMGRIDYAERLPNGGVRLIDYKSALRADLPERYERQLQLYALLWHETFGEWPAEALVVYPFTGATHKVAVDPEICRQVGFEARQVAQKLQEGLSAELLASPGTVCRVCEFRPWCRPFWKWQAGHASHSQALEDAVYGFEGTILGLELKEYHWKVTVGWRDAEVRIVAPQERFPQLKNARIGMRVRALDMRLHGQRYRPQAIVSESSEIFLIE